MTQLGTLIAAFVNGSLLAVGAFGVGLSADQIGAVMIPVNSAIAIGVLGYNLYAKRQAAKASPAA